MNFKNEEKKKILTMINLFVTLYPAQYRFKDFLETFFKKMEIKYNMLFYKTANEIKLKRYNRK